MRAAVNYRNPKAQYHLGKIFLKGEGREKNPIQATMVSTLRKKRKSFCLNNAWKYVASRRKNNSRDSNANCSL